jgi:hypothetical protein
MHDPRYEPCPCDPEVEAIVGPYLAAAIRSLRATMVRVDRLAGVIDSRLPRLSKREAARQPDKAANIQTYDWGRDDMLGALWALRKLDRSLDGLASGGVPNLLERYPSDPAPDVIQPN